MSEQCETEINVYGSGVWQRCTSERGHEGAHQVPGFPGAPYQPVESGQRDECEHGIAMDDECALCLREDNEWLSGHAPDSGAEFYDAETGEPMESGQQNQQGDQREIVARWLWEHDDEVSDGSMQDASWDAATDMRAGYYAAADDLLARLAGGQQ